MAEVCCHPDKSRDGATKNNLINKHFHSGVGRLLQTNLLFDYDYHQSSSAQNGRDANQLAAQETLQRICFWSKSDVQQDAPLQFWQLMRALKKLDYSMLKKFHENIDYICSTSLRGRSEALLVFMNKFTLSSAKYDI